MKKLVLALLVSLLPSSLFAQQVIHGLPVSCVVSGSKVLGVELSKYEFIGSLTGVASILVSGEFGTVQIAAKETNVKELKGVSVVGTFSSMDVGVRIVEDMKTDVELATKIAIIENNKITVYLNVTKNPEAKDKETTVKDMSLVIECMPEKTPGPSI